MATMTEAQREAVTADFMRRISRELDSLGAIEKSDLRATVNAADDYYNANAAAMNNTLPPAPKAELTKGQKALIWSLALLKRYTEDT